MNTIEDKLLAVQKENALLKQELDACKNKLESLEHSKSHFQKIFEHSNDAIFIVEPLQDNIIDANPRACEMLGYSRKELMDLPASAIHPEDLKLLQNFAKSVYRKGSGWTSQLTCTKKDGITIPSEVSATVIELEEGKCILASVRDLSRRKDYEDQITWLASFPENNSNPVLELTCDGRLVYSNPATKKIFPELHTQSSEHPLINNWMTIKEKLSQSEKNNVIREVQVGENFYLQSFNYVQDKSHIRMYVIDITESKKREQALLASEEKFRNVVESLGEGLLITNFDDEIKFVNSTMCKLTGFEEHELIGERGFELLLDQEQWNTLKSRNERRKSGNNEVYEIPLKKKDGSYFWALIHASPYTDVDGHSIGTLGAITDISDRKDTEIALRNSRKSLEQLVENMQEGIYRISLDGDIIYVNEALAKIHGLESAEDLIGQNVTQLTEHSNYLRQEFMQDLIEQGVVRNYQSSWKNYKGDRRYTIENAILVRDDDGDVKYYEGTVMDVTEQKHLEEQLLQAQKMEAIGRLAGGVAHDFNNILTIILGYSRLMLGSFDTTSEYYGKLQQIAEAGERAESLVRQLLSFSRKQSASPKVLNVNTLVKNMEKMLQRLLPENKMLVTELSDSIGNVKADPAHIEQVIMNLVVNARDATESDGHITIESVGMEVDEAHSGSFTEIEPGNYVRISVSDDGIGMSPEVVQHIFEPFFTTKKEGEGTGLGLSTVYGIIKQNNGYVHVYSEPGNGTTFHVYLPVSQQQEKQHTNKSSEHAQDYNGVETILLAEDDKSVLDFLSSILTDNGYSVVTAKNGLEAFHLFGENPSDYDLVITDVVMPKIDGPEFIKRARGIKPELKSIFISGHTKTMITNSGIDKDQPFLQKPFPISELMKIVRETIDFD